MMTDTSHGVEEAPPAARTLTGMGLTLPQLRSILNRGGGFLGRENSTSPMRRVLHSRWQAHAETLQRGIDRIAGVMGAHETLSFWPLGNSYWFRQLQTEHDTYRQLMGQVSSELAYLDSLPVSQG